MKVINDRNCVYNMNKNEHNLGKIFITHVCINQIYSEHSNLPKNHNSFFNLYEKFIEFNIPTSKFTQLELDKIQCFGRNSFVRRWSGYETVWSKYNNKK